MNQQAVGVAEVTECTTRELIQTVFPPDIRRWVNAGTMLAHRLRRWANIVPTLAERLVFRGYSLHPISEKIGRRSNIQSPAGGGGGGSCWAGVFLK